LAEAEDLPGANAMVHTGQHIATVVGPPLGAVTWCRRQQFRHTVLAVVAMVASLGFLETVVYSIGPQVLHASPSITGLLFSLKGAGAVLGALVSAPASCWSLQRVRSTTDRLLGRASAAADGILALPQSISVAVGAGVRE
jgi:predicted MFS family arabinose efflux permease